ncbi:unnamed protein product [Nyctereutes procyonoides]|uniref:(raccoon dog) hypothetical protein n=1 Tax=Nyctereutes procyonoides TaxID=34880 RepID=A0A811Z3U0_NYCPR|nr:unnamed protein product [Nyctereutes procyonoides]
MLYWLFSTSDLYNWKTQNAKFSDNPRDLIGLLDTVLFTHQPTWDDCQQLLQVLFTTEERERIQVEARKSVLGGDRQPTQNPDLINAAFPLSHPTWDYNSAEGKERLRVYRQTLMAGLKAAACKPTNLAKVYDVAPDIKKKLQRVERLGEKSLQDLAIVAERGSQGLAPLPEPRVTLKVEGQPVEFLVDTGAQHSVLLQPQGKLANKTSWVQGATGTKQYSWTTRRTVDLGTGRVSHSFMVIPLNMGAQICFYLEGAKVLNKKGHPIQVLVLGLEDEYRLHQMPSAPMTDIDSWLREFPAWTETGGIGLAQHRLAIYIELKLGGRPCQGPPIPHASTWNTPLLPVLKPHSNDYRPVQDLREVNRRVEDMHPTVPNLYTLLSTLPPDKTWYTVLDLKDAFFSLPLAPKSQDLFAFEWTDPEKGINGQLTWTQLPQGFKNSLTIFNEALHEDLGEFRSEHPHLTLLKYVDDNLLAAEDQDTCLRGTRDLLQTIAALGYGASAKKAQICRTEVSYLGYKLQDGQRWLTETILRIPQPQTVCQVHRIRADLQDQPLPNADATWYMNGSSFVQEGLRFAGAAVATETETVWAEPLAAGTSAQRAELIALAKALTMGEGK